MKIITITQTSPARREMLLKSESDLTMYSDYLSYIDKESHAGGASSVSTN